VQFDPQTVTATALPAISIAEPDGCAYELGKAEGSYSAVGEEERAAWKVTGSATLAKGTPCSPELHVEGFIELFPRGAGSPLPWKSLESLEREQKEREAQEKAGREAKERQEAESALASLANALFPTATSTRINGLLKANGWAVSFTAPWAGELVINWYQVPHGAHLSKKPHPTLVASGRADFTTGSATRKVTIRLTAKGQQLLNKAKGVTLTATGAFLSFSKPALTVKKTFTLKRARGRQS